MKIWIERLKPHWHKHVWWHGLACTNLFTKLIFRVFTLDVVFIFFFHSFSFILQNCNLAERILFVIAAEKRVFNRIEHLNVGQYFICWRSSQNNFMTNWFRKQQKKKRNRRIEFFFLAEIFTIQNNFIDGIQKQMLRNFKTIDRICMFVFFNFRLENFVSKKNILHNIRCHLEGMAFVTWTKCKFFLSAISIT